MDPADSELQELIAAFLDGAATEAQTQRLSHRLRESRAARDAWLVQADLHARLAVDETLWSAAGRKTARPKPARQEPVEYESVEQGAGSLADPVAEILARAGRMLEKGAVAPAPPAETEPEEPQLVWRVKERRWPALAAGVLAAAAAAVAVWNFQTPAPVGSGAALPTGAVARFAELDECRWVSATSRVRRGDAILAGQRVELASGSAQILFASGAAVTLVGPAIFEALSGDSARLVIGHLKGTAPTPEAKRFTLQTRTAKVVDVGAEFVAVAAADGRSRVDASVGPLDVQFDGVDAPQRLQAGDALGVEPGERRVVARIERGDDTPRFRFPTIAPPSARDAADRNVPRPVVPAMRAAFGLLSKHSGPVEMLLDGRGQSAQDTPEESVFFDDESTGMLLLDLGRPVSIRKVNSYSWHGNDFRDRVRATQRFSLYGAAGDVAPSVEGALLPAGWELIARVDTEEHFRSTPEEIRPAQQASSIFAAGGGSIGRYRFLLWRVVPSVEPASKRINGTLFGEFDVYGEDPEE